MRGQRALIVVLPVISCLCSLTCVSQPKPKPVEEDDLVRSLEYLEAVRQAAPDSYFAELQTFILGDREPYVKERGIAALTAIAVGKRDTEKVVAFLKTLAVEARDEEVQNAAFAHIELLRTYQPVRQNSSLELSVSGTIEKDETVTLIARVSSSVNLEEEVTVWISSLQDGIKLLEDSEVWKVFLRRNEPQDVEFTLKLKETGRYFVSVAALFSLDRVEGEKIEKMGHLVVEEAAGRFTTLEDKTGEEIPLVMVR